MSNQIMDFDIPLIILIHWWNDREFSNYKTIFCRYLL